MHIERAAVDLPDFGVPDADPVHADDAGYYGARLQEAAQRTLNAGYDALVVYGDREHAANLAYLTRYDPRFEEALLIIVPGREKPTLLVGNEGMSYTAMVPVPMQFVLYQTFSLPGQPRDSSKPLATILREAGITSGQKIALAGWKPFDNRESDQFAHWSEVPAFIVETLAEIAGGRIQIYNANNLFMHPTDGMRAVNDAFQLAQFEFASSHSSEAIKRVVFGIRPGMTEYEGVQLMQLTGLPHSAHVMLGSGEKAWVGLRSPSSRKIQHGDAMTTALGVWGALTCRAGFLVKDASELPENIRDYEDKLVKPYFRAVAEWYEAIGIGVTGGELYGIIHKHIGDPFFGVGLNPGHLIHIDEWLHSPVYKDSPQQLKSGMAIQVDVIPGTGTAYYTTNIEDGIALADETLRAEIARDYPQMWLRIQQRRAFMEKQLGIHLKPEVLPFSNIPAYLMPFWLSPTSVMRVIQ